MSHKYIIFGYFGKSIFHRLDPKPTCSLDR